MPRQKQPWFRFYVETMGDRKIRRLTPAERWAWAGVLAAARESPSPGRLLIAEGIPMTQRDLADYADVPTRTVASAMTKLTELGVIATDERGVTTVTNWARRQFESDDVTQRTRTHRERSQERSNDDPANVPPNGEGTLQGTPSSRARTTETENRDRTTTLPDEPARERPRDLLFEAVAAACGIEVASLTKSARGSLNGAVGQLRAIEATPGQVAVRARRYREKFRDAALTPPALAKHWASLNGTTGRSSSPREWG